MNIEQTNGQESSLAQTGLIALWLDEGDQELHQLIHHLKENIVD